MADEINTPNHRYYQLQNHIKLAESDMCKSLIFASGIRKIDDKIVLPLFAAAEPGAWFDPSDLTTLFQDDAGTTPVTAPGQTVGKMLDKSGRGNHATQATPTQRPIYGINPIVGTRNLLTYTEQFDNAAWNAFGTKTVAADQDIAPDGTNTADRLSSPQGNGVQVGGITITANTSYTFSVYSKADIGSNIRLSYQTTGGTGTSGIIDVTINTGTSVGNGWFRNSYTLTSAAGDFALVVRVTSSVNDATPGIFIWGAQLEASATATAYQKVVSQYEVTQAGVQSVSYLAFDGVDDGMVTNTITPAIDKAQVFAGVRKLSDVNQGQVCETGPNVGTNNGGFRLFAPNAAGAANYLFVSKGTLAGTSTVTNSAYAAPVTNILTGLGDISGDYVNLRINGSDNIGGAADQGTGDFLANPLYIGRRITPAAPFNGRIYSLITRFGANLTTGQITSTESWVNAKTGAY